MTAIGSRAVVPSDMDWNVETGWKPAIDRGRLQSVAAPL